MEQEISIVKSSLKEAFESASDIYVNPVFRECEVTVSIDDYQGEEIGYIVCKEVTFTMVDYCDVYPFKYVFSYRPNPAGRCYLA